LRYLCLAYWIPCLLISFYANAAFSEQKIIGVILIGITSLVAMLSSYLVSGMPARLWYHEILFCGVDKLSMSITSLSENGGRSFWMFFFEGYFGLCIKFVNPACLTFLFFQNLIADIEEPYGE